MIRWQHRVKRALFACGFYKHRLRTDRFPNVAVLCYHGVRPDDWPERRMAFEGLHVRAAELDAHCAFLKATCHPITLAQWKAAISGGPQLPDRPVLVTFDDGYRSVKTVARQILRRHGVPATLFVCTHAVERRQLLWFDAIALTRGEEAVQRLKDAPFDDWHAAIAGARTSVSDHEPHALLTVAEIGELAREGFEIGGHTDEHLILARADPSEQERQIRRNHEAVEAWAGRPATAFAYPNGGRSDYTADTIAILSQTGYETAFTAEPGFGTNSPLFERPRYLITAGLRVSELAHRLYRSWRR